MKLSTFLKLFKNNLAIIIVIVAGVLASRTLIFQSGYFNMHDDLQMMRQLEMEKCFKDFQIPCRWVPDMGYGYGFPLFNFYPPFPYLVGQIFRVLQFSFVDTVKIVFSLAFILSGVFMYLLGKEFWGKWGGVVSAVFYIWAPYHSVDVYVRGAMNEAWALVFFPLIFLFSYKLITIKGKTFTVPLALSWVGLLLSHNLMVMIFTPIFAVWCLIWFLISKNYIRDFVNLLKSGLLALGLSAFFTIPAIFEQKFVHVDTLVQGYYEYIAHFATIKQLLFSRFWGYGPSVWLEGDGMPFPVGQIHWVLSLIILVFCTWYMVYSKKIKHKFDRNILYTIYFILATGWFAVFMAHSRSTFLWQHVKPLAFTQFPWRFLTLSTFAFSFIAGAMVLFLQKLHTKYFVLGTAITILIVIVYNWNFFLPQNGKMGPLTDSEKFSGAAWDLQRTAGIFDYLPKTAKENPKDGANILATIIRGKTELSDIKAGTNWASFRVNGEDSTIKINIFDFPNWKITIDGNDLKHYIPDTEKYGTMYVDIPKGEHQIYLKLENTPIRTITNIISLVTWLGLIGYVIFKKQK